ncbi:hypothetical protein IMSHALPRED_009109 [Imshaugia aleurites]|uniref:Uncharacterized protein n=1 Tax=Imshaugia aleurites TaxID=172621 RepID=A0A8H3G4Z5_9LECA|nr:hypothetical protein IMSHALPRED_009109 [Imshaugia aleurites]
MHLPLLSLALSLLTLTSPPLARAEEAPNVSAGDLIDDGCLNQTCPLIHARFKAAGDEIAELDDKATTPAFLSGYWSALQDVVAELC